MSARASASLGAVARDWASSAAKGGAGSATAAPALRPRATSPRVAAARGRRIVRKCIYLLADDDRLRAAGAARRQSSGARGALQVVGVRRMEDRRVGGQVGDDRGRQMRDFDHSSRGGRLAVMAMAMEANAQATAVVRRVGGRISVVCRRLGVIDIQSRSGDGCARRRRGTLRLAGHLVEQGHRHKDGQQAGDKPCLPVPPM